MYSRLLLVLSLLLTLCLSSQSQTLADYQFSTGHDASRWYSLDSSRNLIIMSGSRYYRRSGLEEIGFNFPFADTNYSQFSVTHDGNLRLGNVLAVSSSGNQGSPFVASRAGTNNPKINFMGCAGYSSDSIYVHKQLFGSSPDRVMVIEFALQTYISSSRPSLLRWQVQLHENGDIQIVYPSRNPPLPPACNHQQGMCVDETDIWIVDQYHVATHYTEGYPTHIPASNWPDPNRFYRFNFPYQTCNSPQSLIAYAIDTMSVSLSWRGNASEYIVEYAHLPFVPGNGSAQHVIVSDTTAYIYGLPSGTQYHFYVRSICNPGDTSNAAHLAAQTLSIEPVNAGSYFCDFESASERDCWIVPVDNVSAKWYIGSAANNSPNGQYALYVSQDSGATNSCGENWIGTYAYRSFNLEAGDWNVSFDWRAYGDWNSNSAGNTNYYQFLRAFLAPSSASLNSHTPPSFPSSPHSTSVPQGWIELNPSSHAFVGQSSWTSYSSIANVSTPGCYNLVFYWESDGYLASPDLPGAIDNISLERVSCAQPRAISASAFDNDILLSWQPGNSENLWRVVCDNFDMIVNDTFCLVTGLSFNTLYNFNIYAICGDSDTSFATSFSYRTSAGAPVSSYPYFCDFEDSLMARQWVSLGEGQSNAWYVGHAANNTPQGTMALYVSHDGGSTNSYSGASRSLSYAYRMLSLDTANYVCSFDWRCLGDEGFHFFRAFIVPANDIPSAGSFPSANNIHTSVPSGWIDLNPQDHYMSGQSSWTSLIQPFNVTQPGDYALLFMWENDEYSANNPPAAIDNINIATFSCPIPTGLTADPYLTYIDLTWDAPDNANVWMIEYNDTVITAFSPSLNADNLTPNSEYTFRVYNLCTNGDTSLPASITVRTLCYPIETLPFSCDFSDYPVGTGGNDSFIPCWSRVLNYNSFSPQINNSFSSGNNCLYWNLTSGLLDDAIIVLPQLDESIDVDNTQLRFKAMSIDYIGMNETPVFIVGVMTDPATTSSFSAIDTVFITNEGSFSEYSVPLHSYEGSGQYVALRGIVNGSNYSSAMCLIDDILLEESLFCRRPSAFSALAGIDSAALSWTPGGNESEWILQYGDTILTTHQPNYIARNLVADREYYYSVAAICDLGDTSATLTGSFRTLPTTPNPPDSLFCPDIDYVSATAYNPANPYNITICWSNTASAYEVVVSNVEHQNMTHSAYVVDSSCHLFELESVGGQWSAKVRSVCDNDVFGEWSEVTYFSTPAPSGIVSSSDNGDISLFPNPTNGKAYLSIKNHIGNVSICVIDITGSIIAERIVTANGNTLVVVPLNGLATGTYFIRVSSATDNSVKKLIVK